jgi:hypothetical protein
VAVGDIGCEALMFAGDDGRLSLELFYSKETKTFWYKTQHSLYTLVYGCVRGCRCE